MASMWAGRPLGGYIVQLLAQLSLSHTYLLCRLHGEMVAIKRLYFNKPKWPADPKSALWAGVEN